MLSIEQHIQDFLDFLKFQKRYSVHTLISYKNDLLDLKDFLATEFEESAVESISVPMLRSWLASLKQRGMASKTINRKISTAKSLFKFLVRQETIQTNPASALSSLKVPKRLPTFVEQKDMERLLRPESFENDWNGKLSYLILDILYQTGIREQELLKIQHSDIERSSGLLRIVGKGNKERLIPLSAKLLRHIDDYIADKKRLLENPGPFLLVNQKGKPLYPKFVYNLVKKYLGEVTTQEKRSPHVLRHSFATVLSNRGAPINAIKELLGHSSLSSTQIYTHTGIEALKEIHSRSHPKS